MGEPTRHARTGGRDASANLPTELRPQLATLVTAPPEGDDWIHEIKYDGYRLLGRVAAGDARLITRNGHDWSSRFPTIQKALRDLPIKAAWLDGELVSLTPDGRSSFAALQGALSESDDTGLVYVLFDLLWLDGKSLVRLPLHERKSHLAALLKQSGGTPSLRYSDSVEGNGPSFYDQACEHGLEGIICKRREAPYRVGRGRDWLKVKCTQQQEFVIGGFTESDASTRPFGALLLGLYEGDTLKYAGRVGTGFDASTSENVFRKLHALQSKDCPYASCPASARGETLRWVRPQLVAQVQFSNRTADGLLRHPSFLGLREDKAATTVVPEQPTPIKEVTKSESRRDIGASSVRLSNPNKKLWPDDGVTKRDLGAYYEAMAERMLPFVAKRPLSLLRCPDGHQHDCFFQKHVGDDLPAGLEAAFVVEKEKAYPMVTHAEGLLALVQLGTLEIHGWGSRQDRPERPDQITLDLDPGPQVPWQSTVHAAQLLRVLLEGLGLGAFPKTTGGKGLHVVVPIERRYSWDEVKRFSKAIATQLVRFDPGIFTTKLGKAGRDDKIFIDYLRNGRGATAVVPYSPRARPGAPVAIPIAWDEVDASLAPNRFCVAALLSGEVSVTDQPWPGFSSSAKRITADMWRALTQS